MKRIFTLMIQAIVWLNSAYAYSGRNLNFRSIASAVQREFLRKILELLSFISTNLE